MLKKKERKKPNKEQSQSARGTQLYLQTVFYVEAGSGIEQMDDKSVSNEGKHTARCRCFRGSTTNLFISVFTVDAHSAAGQRARKNIRKGKCPRDTVNRSGALLMQNMEVLQLQPESG